MVNDLEFIEEGDKDVFPMWRRTRTPTTSGVTRR